MMNRISILFSTLLVAGLMVFTSCDKDDDDQTSANVMVVHASPDGPGVDVLIDNDKQNSAALTYPNNTGYIDVETGTRNIKVNVAGTATSVINVDLTFENDKNYSIFAVDSVTDITAIALVDDLTNPASGKAHVRFVHLSPDAPAVDIAVVGTGGVIFDDVAFKEGTGFTSLDAGTYLLDVRLAGTGTVALVLPSMTFQAGKIYTVWAKGFVSGTGSQSLGTELIVNK